MNLRYFKNIIPVAAVAFAVAGLSSCTKDLGCHAYRSQFYDDSQRAGTLYEMLCHDGSFRQLWW